MSLNAGLMQLCVQNDNTTKTLKRKTEQKLSDYSPKDSKWDTERGKTQQMADFLYESGRFEKWAERMDGCTRVLSFSETIDQATGEVKPKLSDAYFCHCRHCTTCDGRRSLVRMKRFKDYLPTIEAENPKARWVFLTLTVPNCPVDELRETLRGMNAAWNRLRLRKQFKPVLGWIRATEVTQEKKREGYAHPHFHCLLLVPPSWFNGRNYVKQADWVELWRSCMRLEVNPVVDVRAVKGDTMRGAVETLKAFNYSMKVDDLIERSPDWMLTYMEQVHGLRFLAAGGALKDALKRIEEETTDTDLIHVDGEQASNDNGARRAFSWRPSEKIYRRFTKGDKPAVTDE